MELKEVLENGLVEFNLECLDCGYDHKAFIPFGFNPDLKLECPKCYSRNTERT